MKPRISIITLAVDNLQVSLKFYRDGLGLTTEGLMGTEFEHGAVVFFELEGGLKLAIWPRESLAHDTSLPVSSKERTQNSPAFSIGHNVGSKAAVDALMAQALISGATIVKPAQTTFWGGYGGYFQDPDGHLWEVVWNPDWSAED
ncbi:MAG: VOC family protein [Methylophilus sp.]|uniref:VOC family protein n=1 Tax=Methylophilus sp. TaxID=29541 RepID=UPI003F9FFF2F